MADAAEDTVAAGYGGRATAVYEALHREILALSIAPGAPLDETQIAQRFGMSRSPVREALNRLAAQGLVVMLPNRSTVVAPIELEEFPRYVEALILVQRVCTRLAAERRNEADLGAMRRAAHAFDAAVKPYDHLEMSAANKAFHMTIGDAAHNRYLSNQYDALLDEGRRLLHLQFRHLQQAANQNPLAEDHNLMIDAIEARDADRADALALAHAQGFQRRLLEFLGNVGTGEVDLSGLAATPSNTSQQEERQ